MLVEKGNLGDVSVDGAKWAVTYHWPGPLHEGHGTAQPILDAGMSDEQREALGAILPGENGGTFYGILAPRVPQGAVSDSGLSGWRSVANGDRRAKSRAPGVAVSECTRTETQIASAAAAKMRSPCGTANRST